MSTVQRQTARADAAQTGEDGGTSDAGQAPVRTELVHQIGITVVAASLFLFFSLTAAHFADIGNILDTGRSIAFVTIVGVGMTYLFIAGEFDISVGSQYGLATIVMAILVGEHGIPPWPAACLVLAMGAAIGLFNGVITTVVGVPSFIVTLGMYSALRGIALVLSGAFPINFPEALKSTFFGATSGTLFGAPAQLIWMFAVLIVGGFVLRMSRFGYHVYATGGNASAARASGIRTRRVKIACFILTGVSCSLIAALQTGWFRTASPTTGGGFELQVIGAVIIGGVALGGGEGSIYGTFIGAIILGMLTDGIVLMGVDGNYTQIIVGAIIILAASLDVLLRRDSRLAGMLGAAPARFSTQPRRPTQSTSRP